MVFRIRPAPGTERRNWRNRGCAAHWKRRRILRRSGGNGSHRPSERARNSKSTKQLRAAHADWDSGAASAVAELKLKTPSFCDEAFNSKKIFDYTLKEEPHPQVLFTFGFSNLKPEASSVSTKSTTQPFRYMA